MNSKTQFALAAALFVLASLVSTHAVAATKSGGTHARSVTYHDRTPRAHVHESHPHHS
jgi:Spy/CpxP family protein refolding chaperone